MKRTANALQFVGRREDQRESLEMKPYIKAGKCSPFTDSALQPGIQAASTDSQPGTGPASLAAALAASRAPLSSTTIKAAWRLQAHEASQPGPPILRRLPWDLATLILHAKARRLHQPEAEAEAEAEPEPEAEAEAGTQASCWSFSQYGELIDRFCAEYATGSAFDSFHAAD